MARGNYVLHLLNWILNVPDTSVLRRDDLGLPSHCRLRVETPGRIRA